MASIQIPSPNDEVIRFLLEKFQHLDLVGIRGHEDFHRLDTQIVRLDLADGRSFDIRVNPALWLFDIRVNPALWLSKLGPFNAWLTREVEKVLTRGYRRCLSHEDCSEVQALGEACWQATYGAAMTVRHG